MPPVYLAGLWVFMTKFFRIRVLTEDQAVYLLPKSGCRHTDEQKEGRKGLNINMKPLHNRHQHVQQVLTGAAGRIIKQRYEQ